MEQQLTQSAYDIILPVIEKSAILAAEYTKACGRSTLTAEDLKYATMYCAMNQVGVHIGSVMSDSDSDSDSESDCELETVDEDDEPFTRYSGQDQLMNNINQCHDTWSTWEPTNPAEKMLKNAIDKNM
jgi:hypothetical protein